MTYRTGLLKEKKQKKKKKKARKLEIELFSDSLTHSLIRAHGLWKPKVEESRVKDNRTKMVKNQPEGFGG